MVKYYIIKETNRKLFAIEILKNRVKWSNE